MEEKKEQKQRQPRKKQKKSQKGIPRIVFIIILFVIVVIGIIFLGKYLNKRRAQNEFLENIHEDVSLTKKEKSYYDLLLSAMDEHKNLVTGAEHVYFNLFEMPDLEHEERENIAKKVLHSFAVHKDKELLMDTFDGLYFRGILNIETSELKDGIYVTFEDISKGSKKQYAISIYKTSNLNPTLTYDIELNDGKEIVKYNKVSDLMPHQNVEQDDKSE